MKKGSNINLSYYFQSNSYMIPEMIEKEYSTNYVFMFEPKYLCQYMALGAIFSYNLSRIPVRRQISDAASYNHPIWR